MIAKTICVDCGQHIEFSDEFAGERAKTRLALKIKRKESVSGCQQLPQNAHLFHIHPNWHPLIARKQKAIKPFIYHRFARFLNGASEWNRTTDLGLMSPTL